MTGSATTRPTPCAVAIFTDLRSALRSHRGREFKSVGDGMMAVFRSAIGALVCAADMRSWPLPSESRSGSESTLAKSARR